MKKVVKTAVIGYPGVGKSTLIKLLCDIKNLKSTYSPTIGVDFGTVSINNDFQISLWDLAGQEQFHFLWDSFLHGSSLICVVTDSQEKNVKKTKHILDKYRKNNGAKIIAIANKQDVQGAMDPQQIENFFGVETIGMVAVDPNNKQKLFNELMKYFSR